MDFKKNIPFLGWITTYSKKQLLGDIPAGLTVGIILIPQGMAYAMIAGLPPVFGLYAALVPQVIYAFLGTSRQLAVGPVAMDSLLVASGLSVMAIAGSENYIFLAICLAFLIGLFQLLMGAFRLGFIVNFLSKPVISGFTSGAAVIIAFNQLKHMLGVDIERSNQIHQILHNLYFQISEMHVVTVTMSFVGIAMIILLKKIAPKIPSAIVVVILGILVTSFLDLELLGVSVVGEIAQGLPSLIAPHLSVINSIELLPVALTLSLVSYMEAISIAKTIEQKHNYYKVDPNKELIALGASNLIGSFFQSYPTTGGLSRTAVNNEAGAKTGIASLISAIVVGFTLLFLTPLFYYLPHAALASIIVMSILTLIDYKYPLRLWKNRKDEFFLLMFAFVITLVVGITEGIVLGVLLSLLILIYRTTKPHMAVLGKFSGQNLYKNINRFPEVKQREEILIVRFDAQLYFANASFFKENLMEQIKLKGDNLKLLVLSVEAINYIDSSAANMLRRTCSEISNAEIQIKVTNAIGPVRDIFEKSDITAQIGSSNFYLTVQDAIDDFDGKMVVRQNHITLQNDL